MKNLPLPNPLKPYCQQTLIPLFVQTFLKILFCWFSPVMPVRETGIIVDQPDKQQSSPSAELNSCEPLYFSLFGLEGGASTAHKQTLSNSRAAVDFLMVWQLRPSSGQACCHCDCFLCEVWKNKYHTSFKWLWIVLPCNEKRILPSISHMEGYTVPAPLTRDCSGALRERRCALVLPSRTPGHRSVWLGTYEEIEPLHSSHYLIV